VAQQVLGPAQERAARSALECKRWAAGGQAARAALEHVCERGSDAARPGRTRVRQQEEEEELCRTTTSKLRASGARAEREQRRRCNQARRSCRRLRGCADRVSAAHAREQ
jgi:hypothetical protein